MHIKYVIDALEAELIAQNRQADKLAAAEIAEGEIAQITLLQRLHSALGKEISAHAGKDQNITGTVSEVGDNWALLKTTSGEELLNLAVCVTISGLGSTHQTAGLLQKRSQMQQILRRLARRRVRLQLRLTTGEQISGYLGAVYKDHLEIITEQSKNRVQAVIMNAVFAVKILQL